MGREVRKVPPDWEHPVRGEYPSGGPAHVPLFGGSYSEHLAEWEEAAAKWEEGFKRDWIHGGWKARDGSEDAETYEEWDGPRPAPEDYMPEWPEEEATHYMMYETCSEGTPISPAFETPEELAEWLASTGASAFGGQTASYEAWLRVCPGGWAPSAMATPETGLISGVEAMAEIDREETPAYPDSEPVDSAGAEELRELRERALAKLARDEKVALGLHDDGAILRGLLKMRDSLRPPTATGRPPESERPARNPKTRGELTDE